MIIKWIIVIATFLVGVSIGFIFHTKVASGKIYINVSNDEIDSLKLDFDEEELINSKEVIFSIVKNVK